MEKIKFKGHETFALREGWVYKCLSEIDVNETHDLFHGINPISRLGVGSNMTKAIKYWLKTFNFIEDRAGKGTYLTELGKLVKEYDIYCEDIFTVWLMHINLATNMQNATSWFIFFNYFDAKEFTNENVTMFILDFIKKRNLNGSEKSIASDVQVLTRMYGDEEMYNLIPEDNTMSPISRLQLIKRKQKGFIRNKPSLEIISCYTVLYIISLMLDKQQTISIDMLENDPYGVGRLLGITRADINYFLDELEDLGFIQVIRTAGLNTINIIREDVLVSNNVVKLYYQNV